MAKNQARAVTLLLFCGVAWAAGPFFHDAQATQNTDPNKETPAKKDVASEQTIRDLIKQLGDDVYDKREAADKRLEAIGEPAVPLLQKAAQENPDAEVRERAAALVKRLGNALFTQIRRFEGHAGGEAPWLTRVAVTPDGRLAVSVGTDALRCWDLATGKQDIVLERKGTYCWGFAISADGKRVIAGCAGKQAHVFDLTTGKRVQRFTNHKGAVWGVALTADGKQAISGGDDRTIRVWEVDSGKEIRTFKGVVDNIRCLALSTNGKLVATGHFTGDDQPAPVRVWDFATGTELRACHGHREAITSVAFSPDGKSLLSTSWDTTVRLWDVATGKELKCFEGHTNRAEYAAFTPDGKRIVSSGNAYDSTLRLWDVASGKQLLQTEVVPGGLWGVAVLPDGRHCVSAGGDSVVRLWQWKR
jgi:hypothetical protein